MIFQTPPFAINYRTDTFITEEFTREESVHFTLAEASLVFDHSILHGYTLFFIRTSKFWPSFIVSLRFLGNLSLNCS